MPLCLAFVLLQLSGELPTVATFRDSGSCPGPSYRRGVHASTAPAHPQLPAAASSALPPAPWSRTPPLHPCPSVDAMWGVLPVHVSEIGDMDTFCDLRAATISVTIPVLLGRNKMQHVAASMSLELYFVLHVHLGHQIPDSQREERLHACTLLSCMKNTTPQKVWNSFGSET